MSIEFLQLLILIITANSTPVVARLLLRQRFETPVDCNLLLPDGNPLFGASKTWRGLLSAILVTAIVAWAIGRTPWEGVLAGTWVMVGDLTSSFIKRRLGMAASSKATGLDQIPESLFAAVMMRHAFGLDLVGIILVTASFTVLEIVCAWPFYKLGLRKHPY